MHDHCPTPIGYLNIHNTIEPIPCKSWKCPYCSKIKRKFLLDRITLNFNNNDITRCITLTQKLGSTRNILKDFEYLRRKLARHKIRMYRYVWSKEFTKQSQPHLHILYQGDYIDQKRLSNYWYDITKGESYIVWINKAEITNAAGYMFKYCVKAYSNDPRFKPHERRFGFSNNCKRNQFEYSQLLGDFWELIGGFTYQDVHARTFTSKRIKIPKFELEYHKGDYLPCMKKEHLTISPLNTAK